MDRLRFGIFMAPFHAHGNPTAALQRDLATIELLDELDYDEAWIGEHHSCGTEIIADPFVFAAAAFERTKHIKIGTGVASIPYHNPLWTADKALLLDHLSRGRFMLGVGPGALPTDAHMIGIHPSEQRRMLDEGMEAIMHLLNEEAPLTMKTDWFNLVDAKCQLPRYSDFDIAAAAIASPSGPKLAGKHGIGLLSIGATMQAGADVLAMHWNVAEESAAANGKSVDRAKWALVGVMHCAETREQAYKDVEYGIGHWFDYLQHTAAAPHFVPEGNTLQEMIHWANESGVGAIGTPEDVAAQIDSLHKQSNGGFGSYLMMAHEWANPAATRRSYELIAEEVMPLFQNATVDRLNDAARRAQAVRAKLAGEQADALTAFTEQYHAQKAGS
jgi:limonene 1,2-monooxygenase